MRTADDAGSLLDRAGAARTHPRRRSTAGRSSLGQETDVVAMTTNHA
jgi:hypothetical protein